MSDPLRVGILGCGGFAHVHAKIVTSLPEEAQLVAFSDRNDYKVQAFREQYAPEAGTFTDHYQMFEQANLDLLISCLPPAGHTDEVQLAAQGGVHILIEKPIALDSDQAWAMVEATESAGVKTQVGFMFRFGEAVERFKTLQAEGKTGPVALMMGRYFCNALHAPWWRMKDKSGGQVVEQAIHLFDLVRYMAGDAVGVYSQQANLFHQDVPDYTSEDTSATVVRLKHGGMGMIGATNNAIPGKWISDYRLVAQRLTAEFANANNAVFTYTDQPDNPTETIESSKDFRLALMLDLINAIRTDGETRIPMREGALSLDLVLGAGRSSELRAEVAL
jgi:predicted dehydrogenase